MGCIPWGLMCLLLTMAACGEPAALPSPEPSFEGCATDENWMALDQHAGVGAVAPSPDGPPIFLAPAPGATLPAAESALFRFAVTQKDTTKESGDAACPQYQPRGFPAKPSHLPAVTGTLFDLRFTSGGEPIHRVLTTRRFASLPPARWRALGGAQLQVFLSYARLQNNAVIAGPYAADPLAFSIATP